jgi:DNA polymerase-3 subunit epsilon/exodeoxyribonuclease X
MTKLLCDYLLELSNIQEMIRLSLKPVLLQKFEFGKYAGRYIEEISLSDKNYLNWMLNNLNLDEDLRYTLEYYL